MVFPQALGVGYDTIGALLQGDVPRQIILGILIVKSVIWAASLGSGTSGGVLAPLLMMGGALGGLEAGLFQHLGMTSFGAGFWPLEILGAILGGTMRSPLTGILFAIELTHDLNMLLPLLIACFMAHAFTVLTLKRSILTEKVSRRPRLSFEPRVRRRSTRNPAGQGRPCGPDWSRFPPAVHSKRSPER